MKLTIENEEKVRKYLLGDLSEEDQAQIEQQLLSDDEFYEALSVVEGELRDDYVMETLTEREREQFKSHFLKTPERQRKLRYAMRLRDRAIKNLPVEDEVSDQIVKTPKSRNNDGWKLSGYLKLAAVAFVALVAVGLGVWWLTRPPSEIEKGLTALKQAYREQRPTEARITGFDYAPLPSVRGGEQQKVDSTSLRLAQVLLLDKARDDSGPSAHHAVGRLYLAERNFDEAIKHFDQALKGDANNAQLHSDYGAALLEKGRSGDGSGKSHEEFAQSLEHLSRALELDDSLLEALFNRALCQEYMGARRGAIQDWKSYIEKDPNSRWAEEARQKLTALESSPPQSSHNREQVFQEFLDAYKTKDDRKAWELINCNRNYAGSFIENRLIDNYLDLAEKGRDDEAGEYLAALSYAGEVEQRRAGDMFMPNLARFYKSVTPSRRGEISQARALLKSGHENFHETKFDAAMECYARAKEIFERVGNACEAIYIDYAIGSSYLQQSKTEAALLYFHPLARACEKSHYKFLLAQTLSALSNAYQNLRNFSAAMSNTNDALKLSEEMGDRIGVLKMRFQLGEINRFLNNDRKALDIYFQDLPQTRIYFPQPDQLWARYFSISRAFDQLDMYAAAVTFQKEALHFALQAQAPRLICRSYNYLGFILAKHGNYAEAADSVKRALEIGNSFSDRTVRIEATAYSFLQLGYIYRKAGEFSKAVENYDEAIRFYDELGSQFFAFTARKGKLLCCLEQARCPSIEQDMATVLNLFEGHRSKILEDSNRNTFFDAEQSIYDMAIEFEHYEKGDSRKAFEYSEKSRGRSLSDMASTSVEVIDSPASPDMKFREVSQPMSLEQIWARMPEQSRILQYAVLKDSILIWVVSKGEVFAEPQRVPIEELNKKVGDFLRSISGTQESDFEAFSREAIYLYDLLIKPVSHLLDSSKPLCIVPDKALNYLPFAALKSQASGKYFIEEQEQGFVLSPSSTMFVICSEEAREKGPAKSEKLSSVGNPLFDRKTFPNLDDLQSAAREAETITSYYGSPRPRPLTGASATKRRVISEMERADVIHLATHAVTDEWNPLRSKLLLAKEAAGAAAEGNGVLQAFEIYRLNLARVKLVVLSACRTGVEKYYGGEGMIGLSRPFIARRVPLVVASLWPVNSDATARLMISFHYSRKNVGLATAKSLRAAQLEMLRSSDSNDHLPINWAAFVAIGGHANF
jgi:CHAT domain-containing protein/lipoprotein NlpI